MPLPKRIKNIQETDPVSCLPKRLSFTTFKFQPGAAIWFFHHLGWRPGEIIKAHRKKGWNIRVRWNCSWKKFDGIDESFCRERVSFNKKMYDEHQVDLILDAM